MSLVNHLFSRQIVLLTKSVFLVRCLVGLLSSWSIVRLSSSRVGQLSSRPNVWPPKTNKPQFFHEFSKFDCREIRDDILAKTIAIAKKNSTPRRSKILLRRSHISADSLFFNLLTPAEEDLGSPKLGSKLMFLMDRANFSFSLLKFFFRFWNPKHLILTF